MSSVWLHQMADESKMRMRIDRPVATAVLAGRISDVINCWAASPDDALTRKPHEHTMVFVDGSCENDDHATGMGSGHHTIPPYRSTHPAAAYHHVKGPGSSCTYCRSLSLASVATAPVDKHASMERLMSS